MMKSSIEIVDELDVFPTRFKTSQCLWGYFPVCKKVPGMSQGCPAESPWNVPNEQPSEVPGMSWKSAWKFLTGP